MIRANAQFELIGYKQKVTNNRISYETMNDNGRITAIRFHLKEKYYTCSVGGNVGGVRKKLHQAITKQMEELGWFN